jgi:uncharacterized membrane protein
MTLGAGFLAYWTLRFGSAISNLAGADAWWLYSGDSETGRNLLNAFLTGLITMTSLVVSVTFVILTNAASQLGPRLISFFMSDRQIQLVLGLFLATIFYVILVLRSLDDTLGPEGIPHAAITLATVLTVSCLFALLFYVHKIARSVIADELVQKVWRELRGALEVLLNAESWPKAKSSTECIAPAGALSIGKHGYIQVVDYARLVALASRTNCHLHLDVRAGYFVLENGAHARVCGRDGTDPKFIKEFRQAFVVGSNRTPAQDLEHGLRQLVEIALRGLSPGINDPFTATTVIDRLAAALEQIYQAQLPASQLPDEEGVVRVTALRADHSSLVNAAFDQIRQAGSDHPAIIRRLAEAIGKIGVVATSMERKSALIEQLDKLEASAEAAGYIPQDGRPVSASIASAREIISRTTLS